MKHIKITQGAYLDGYDGASGCNQVGTRKVKLVT
jgi:hypothetical protein